MRTNILSLLLFIALPGVILAEEAKILSMSGEVEVRPTREGIWIPAKDGMEVAEGGAVRTGAKGGAVVLMPNKTKVWFRKSTTLEIEQRQTLASRLMLVFGKVKIRVPHLMRREKFEVRTPVAVCAVRGTEFTMGATDDGKMDLQVLFGEVKLKFTIPPQKGSAEFNIPQGQGLSTAEAGKAVTPVLLTAKSERDAMENWNPGLKPEERQKELQQKDTDRAQIKDFARATNNTENSVKNFLNVVKESDLEAGRTLTDVHGNVVRVDQRMIRPNTNEIQFFNLVKRPVYGNDGSSLAGGGFKYNGAASVPERLDYVQMTMAFNRDLPQRIEEWPSFFNSNTINPSWASFVMANRTDASEIFFIAQGYKYDPTAGREMLVNNPWVLAPNGTTPMLASDPNDRNVILTGVLKNDTGAGGTGISAVEGLNMITRLQVVDAGAANGTLKYTNSLANPVNGSGTGTMSDVVWAIKTDKAASYSEPTNRADNAPIVQYQADMYDVGNAHSSYMWSAKENYVINNGGGIQTAGDFTSTSSDPLTLLKNVALESVMYIKQSQGVNATNPTAITNSALAKAAISNTDYFAYKGAGTNIDLVFIPDLMMAAVQRMLPAITNFKN